MYSPNEIGARIRTQDNACTALPVFVVQHKRRTYGVDPAFHDAKPVWLDGEGNEADADEEKAIRARGHRAPKGWTKTYYVDTWEYVMPFFTEAGAKEYLRINGHNIKGETRIYVESGWRNGEWEALRLFLASLPAPEGSGT